jgi:hypothetical protein
MLRDFQIERSIKMTIIEKRLYSIPEYAKIANTCDSTIWRLVRAGTIPTIRVSKRRFITPQTVEDTLSGKLDLSGKQ